MTDNKPATEQLHISINEKLRKATIAWLNSPKVKKWLEVGGTEKKLDELKKWLNKKYGTEQYFLCEPFFMGIPEYNKDKPLLMVVGQEMDLYGDIANIVNNDGKLNEANIVKSQQWVIEVTKYLNDPKCQPQWENYDGEDTEIVLKIRAFFRLLQELSKYYNICWNNLDKIHYTVQLDNIVSQDDSKNATKSGVKCQTVTLYKEDEEMLFKPDKGCKSLLQEQIEIVQPDAVLFVTGPNYQASMQYQIGNIFGNEKPTQKKMVVNGEIKSGGKIIHCYWTYHPQYLLRSKDCKNFNAVVKFFRELSEQKE